MGFIDFGPPAAFRAASQYRGGRDRQADDR
jgi:hypothetical protein